MATIVLQAAGAFLGGFLGSTGAAIGTAAGAIAGYALDRALLTSTQRREGPRLDTAPAFTAEDGAPVPRLYGTARLGGTLIWATRFEEAATTTRQGFKGGPRLTEYSYFVSAAFALCEGEIAGVRRIWADGRELDRTLYEIRVHRGGEEQEPDPLIAAKQGEDNAPAYRGTAYVVFDRFPLDDYGNRIPQFQFEAMRPVGALAKGVRSVALIPGSTEYGLSPTPVTQTPREGETVAMNRHVLHGETDFSASLDELQMLCPALEHVALVVTWFGTDLRAGSCEVRPKVTDAAATGFSADWRVAGLDRAGAAVVSSAGGGAAFGGSPSDRSVADSIAEIKARGLKVTLYPFVMMDISEGNGLPDPYGRPEQPAYPWRGRITCAIAPGRPGTQDRTAAARDEVEAFCGDAIAADFSMSGGEVAYAGAADDWSYRRFVLHYARLAALAGGVDAFLIGSELRGLSTLRDAADAFPFVEQLCALTDEARGLLGSETALTYGADWSEYFGHQPADGSGDVFFHLDPLWAHPEIAAVGIDNYMPLADWRDQDYAGGNPDGFGSPDDPAGLAGQIAGGEGFDWFYASDADRAARLRTPILDGAHGKPWVFRNKDLVNWWGSAHYDRPGGVENTMPTAWVAGGKPIWMTELGCPATDKGANQPNVFPDPKSSESAAPYSSNGGRCDLAQRRFLEAHLRHWDPLAPGFADAANPQSAIYDGRMVDPGRICLWAWDARPFPAFPLLGELWRDSGNWGRGHWLNGRLAGLSCADLVAAILADAGLEAPDAGAVDGSLQGYVLTAPTTPRAALEPLLDLYGIAAADDGEILRFRSERFVEGPTQEIAELVADGEVVLRTERTPDHALPTEAVLGYRDPLTAYQAATARVVRPGAEGLRQATITLPGVLETGEAETLLADWMARRWGARETISFELPPGQVGVRPGSVVRLATQGETEFLVETVEQGLVRRVAARQSQRTLPAANQAGLPPATEAPGIAGKPAALLLDLPMGPGGGAAQDRFQLAVWARPWRSQAAYASPEASGFERRALVTRAAVLGRLVEPLSAGVEGRSLPQALEVGLYGGELASVSRAQLLNGANAAAVMSAAGGWEVLQFELAEEIAPATWRLSRLLRGQLGSGDQAAAGAPTGAAFVLLDAAVAPAGLATSEIGLALNWRIGPTRHDFSTTHFAEQAAVGGMRALLPLAPVHLRASGGPGGDWNFRWIRRGRIDADGWLATEIPLGEESESYRIDVGLPGLAPLRSTTVASPSWTYAAAERAADFASLPALAEVSVRQLSASAGWGLPAVRRFTLT